MALFESVWQWALGGLSTILLTVGGVVHRNRERSLENQHRLEGDPDNPHDEGLLEITEDTRTKLERMERNVAQDHRDVMRRLDDLESCINGDD